MTTSGSIDFSLNRNELIRASMRLAGILASGEVPNNDEYSDASVTLNLMLKQWQAEGIGLWLNQEFWLFPDYSDGTYLLGPTGGNATASAVITAIATAGVATNLTITVDSATGISNADVIGIELDGGTLQWTTVNGAPAANVITITAALTDAVNVDAVIYSYTTKIQRPQRLLELRRVDSSGSEIPLAEISRQEYLGLALKTALGTPTQYYYDPRLTNGMLYLWPEPDNVTSYIKGTMRRTIYDMDATTDDFDIPPDWFGCLRDNLAAELAVEYDAPVQKQQILFGKAAKSRNILENFDSEQTSVFFQPRLS